MNLRFFLFLTFLLTCLSVKAQFHITPQVGMTFASIKQFKKEHLLYEYSQALDKVNPTIGFSASYPIYGDFGLQSDFFYTQRGSNVNEPLHYYYKLFNVNTHHLDMGLQIQNTSIKNIGIEIGMYYTPIISRDVDEYLFEPLGPFVAREEYYDNEAGASLGLSYTLYNITARAKYSLGLWGTREFEKHHWFLLTLGYRFEV